MNAEHAGVGHHLSQEERDALPTITGMKPDGFYDRNSSLQQVTQALLGKKSLMINASVQKLDLWCS
jgi:hypothetical protein